MTIKEKKEKKEKKGSDLFFGYEKQQLTMEGKNRKRCQILFYAYEEKQQLTIKVLRKINLTPFSEKNNTIIKVN